MKMHVKKNMPTQTVPKSVGKANAPLRETILAILIAMEVEKPEGRVRKMVYATKLRSAHVSSTII